MLKKTSAYAGLVITTAAGALLTSSPANAQFDLGRGSYHHHYSHRSHHRNRNWNGNHNRPRIFIRIYVYNKNNNRAHALLTPPRDEPRPVRVVRAPSNFDDGFEPIQQFPSQAAAAPNAGTELAPAAATPNAGVGEAPKMSTADAPQDTGGTVGAGTGVDANAPQDQDAGAPGANIPSKSAHGPRTHDRRTRGNDETVHDATPIA